MIVAIHTSLLPPELIIPFAGGYLERLELFANNTKQTHLVWLEEEPRGRVSSPLWFATFPQPPTTTTISCRDNLSRLGDILRDCDHLISVLLSYCLVLHQSLLCLVAHCYLVSSFLILKTNPQHDEKELGGCDNVVVVAIV